MIGAKRVYVVELPMPDNGIFQLCKCLTAESAAEVVRVLLSQGIECPATVTVRIILTD